METPETQIKRIVLNRMERCSICHRDFGPEDIRVVSRKNDMWMLVVTCSECHGRNFVAAVMADGDTEEAQIALRQLSRDGTSKPIEITEVRDRAEEDRGEPVSAEDVLDMHEFLDGFDGDFRRLFSTS